MKECPGFEPDAFMIADGVDRERVCKNCRLEASPYCGPLPANFPRAADPHEDRTPIEDRRPQDITDTHDPRYEG